MGRGNIVLMYQFSWLMLINVRLTWSTSPQWALSKGLDPVRPILFTFSGSTSCSRLFLLKVNPTQFQSRTRFKVICYLSWRPFGTEIQRYEQSSNINIFRVLTLYVLIIGGRRDSGCFLSNSSWHWSSYTDSILIQHHRLMHTRWSRLRDRLRIKSDLVCHRSRSFRNLIAKESTMVIPAKSEYHHPLILV